MVGVGCDLGLQCLERSVERGLRERPASEERSRVRRDEKPCARTADDYSRLCSYGLYRYVLYSRGLFS